MNSNGYQIRRNQTILNWFIFKLEFLFLTSIYPKHKTSISCKSIPVFQSILFSLWETVWHFSRIHKLLISFFEADEWALFQDSVIDSHIFILDGFVLLSSKCDIERFHAFHGVWLLFLPAYFWDFFKKQAILTFDFSVLALQKVVFLWVLV